MITGKGSSRGGLVATHVGKKRCVLRVVAGAPNANALWCTQREGQLELFSARKHVHRALMTPAAKARAVGKKLKPQSPKSKPAAAPGLGKSSKAETRTGYSPATGPNNPKFLAERSTQAKSATKRAAGA